VAIQHTTNYGVAYIDAQTSLDQLAAASLEVAQSLDAAMGRAGYSPPDASTFASAVARIGTLEGWRTTTDPKLAYSPQTVTWNTAQFDQSTTAPYTEATRAWKDAQGSIRVQGIAQTKVAIAAGQVPTVLTLPVGYRPATSVIRLIGTPGSASVAPSSLRCEVSTAGVMTVWASVALASGSLLPFDLSFRPVTP
jgi:hypothetical protein